MDFNNINFEKKITKGEIPDIDYVSNKIISGAFGSIYKWFKEDEEEEKIIVEKRFLQCKNDLFFGNAILFISFYKELFIQNLLNKYVESKITTTIKGYELEYCYENNKSIIEKMSFYSNYIENDLRDLSGNELIKENFIDIIKKLLNILSKIHCLGIVHLDIKPGNFLIDEDLNIYLIDFGIARIMNNHFNCKKHCSQRLYTQPYRSFNNVKYIQKYKCNKICNHNVDLKKEDLFALGPLLYELWHGVDELFLDFNEDKKEKKKVFEYFKSGKWMKKYKRFVNKVIDYYKDKCNEKELEELERIMYILVGEENDDRLLESYGYINVELDLYNLYNEEEIEIIELLKDDDLSSRNFFKKYNDRKEYSYELVNTFSKFSPMR